MLNFKATLKGRAVCFGVNFIYAHVSSAVVQTYLLTLSHDHRHVMKYSILSSNMAATEFISNVTPVKKMCIICQKECPTRSFGVNKTSWNKENLSAKIVDLAGEAILLEMKQSEGFLCYRCKLALVSSHEFQLQLKGYRHKGSKRMPKTPLQAQIERQAKKSRPSKKRLFGVSPSPSMVSVSPSCPATSASLGPLQPTEKENVQPASDTLSVDEKHKIITSTEKGTVSGLLLVLMMIPKIVRGMEKKLVEEIQAKCHELSGWKRPSCLRQRDVERLKDPQFFATCYDELKSR